MDVLGGYEQVLPNMEPNANTTGGFDLPLDTTGETMRDFTNLYLLTYGDNSTMITEDRREGIRNSYEYIILISTPVIVILGTFGNALSGLIMLRRKFRSHSTSVYLVALAITDTTFLYANSMTKNFIKVLFRVNYSTTYRHSCAIYVYVLLVSKCISAWLIVAVTSERLIVVFNPLRGKIMATRRRAIISALTITFTIIAVYSFVLLSFEAQVEEEGKIGCAMSSAYKARHVDVILTAFDMVAYSVLPSLILFSCNVALVYKVVQSGKFRRHSASTYSTTAKRKQTLRQSKRLTFTLILLSCVYLILTFPMTVFLCYEAVVSTYYRHRNQLTYRSLYTLQLSNSAINFLLYTSGPAFRQELKRAFCKRSEQDKSRAPTSLMIETQPMNELPSPTSIVTVC